MKKQLRNGLVISMMALAMGLAPRTTRASVPHTLTQQGRLFDTDDSPVSGKVDVTFAIYDKATAATADALWTETLSIQFDNGWFSVALGEVNQMGAIVLNGEPRWLGIKVGMDDEMEPRAAIRSVPYALIAENAIGDITPKSVSIAGVGKVIDENGKWIGDPTGLVGPQGPAGSPDTPTDVLGKFNEATTGGGTTKLGALQFTDIMYDLRWAMQHAAASGACAAASPQNDSLAGHIVIPRKWNTTCASACANNTGGDYTNCRTMIAVGSVRMTQATSHNDVVGRNYNYSCDTTGGNGDEVDGFGLNDDGASIYCCCYK